MKSKVLIISLLMFFIPMFSHAQTPVPYGGNVLMGYPCTCSGGWYISLYDKLTKMTTPLVFQFGVSRLNANYNIFSSGVSNLGSYLPGTGVCLIYVGTGCASVPVFGMITSYPLSGVGTSAK